MIIRLLYGPCDGLEINTSGESPTWWIISTIAVPLIDGSRDIGDQEPHQQVTWYRRTFRTAPARSGNQLALLYRFDRSERR